jgi:hypothetical protein
LKTTVFRPTLAYQDYPNAFQQSVNFILVSTLRLERELASGSAEGGASAEAGVIKN